MDKINYNNRDIPVIYEVDCCIVGGGTAGVAAAIAALDTNVETLVVEKSIYLGGSQTGGLVMPMMTVGVEQKEVYTNTVIQKKLQSEGITVDDGHGNEGWFNVEKLKFVLEQLILERNGKILYDADLIDVVKKENKITEIILNTIQGLVAIRSKTFIDATGNASLSKLSGVTIVSGHENTGKNQSVTLRFEMGGIDLAKFSKHMKDLGDTFSVLEMPFFEAAMVFDRGFVLEDLFRKGIASGDINHEDAKYFQVFSVPGKRDVLTFNCPEIPGNCSTDAKAVSEAISKGREMIQRLSRFLISNMPGFEKAYVNQEAAMLGIRESNRIAGKYVLDVDDYNNRACFEDAIAKTAYYIDLHGLENKKNIVALKKGEYYEIPFRCLITHEVENLAAAGRCISTTFTMQSSIRVQLTCRALGQAAGIGAALSVLDKIPLNEVHGAKIKRIMEKRSINI
jgi:hypothetical protein